MATALPAPYASYEHGQFRQKDTIEPNAIEDDVAKNQVQPMLLVVHSAASVLPKTEAHPTWMDRPPSIPRWRIA